MIRSCGSPVASASSAERSAPSTIASRVTSRAGRLGPPLIFVHQGGEKILIERAPVHPDAHRLPVPDRDFDDRAEVLVAPLAAHVARVDPVLDRKSTSLNSSHGY